MGSLRGLAFSFGKMRQRIRRRLQMAHRHDGPVEVLQNGDLAPDGRIAVVPIAPQVIDVFQNVAGRHPPGFDVALLQANVLAELLQGLLIGGDRAGSQSPRRTVGLRVETNPILPGHVASPPVRSRRLTARCGRSFNTCRYTPVSAGLRCPISFAITARSTPRSIKWVA